MGKIIAIFNQKGGVGKTTTSVNLAASLGVLEQKVLLIDVDPQANASSGLGMLVENIENSSFQLFNDSNTKKECVIKTNSPNLDIIPAHIDLVRVEHKISHKKNIEYLLKQSISQLKSNYDFIIIDCSPTLGLLSLNALIAADAVIIPIQCEYFALEGLNKLLNTIRSLQKKHNPNLDIEGLLLTMYDSRLRLSNQIVNDVQKHFDDLVFRTIIQRNTCLGEAPYYGKSIINYNASSKGALNYLSLAKEIINQNEIHALNHNRSVLGRRVTDLITNNSEALDLMLSKIKNYNNSSTNLKKSTKNSIHSSIKDLAKINYDQLIGISKLELREKLGLSYNDINSNRWMYRLRDNFKITKKNYIYFYFSNDHLQHYTLKRFKNNNLEFDLKKILLENSY